MAGFQVILHGRFWVFTEAKQNQQGALIWGSLPLSVFRILFVWWRSSRLSTKGSQAKLWTLLRNNHTRHQYRRPLP